MTETDRQIRRFAPPRSFADKIADILRNEIYRGVFRPGERLPTEGKLCSTFGVSRAVVREAISALKQDGILESYQGRGIFVSDRPPEATFRLATADLDDLEELERVLEFLIAHETAATSLAAERRTEEELQQIKDALDAMNAAITRNEAGVDEDLAFHAAISAATNNEFFVSFNAFLENRVRHLIREARANSSRAGLTKYVQQEHDEIYAAIEARDRDAARIAAERHLRNAAERLRQRGTSRHGV
ncbi:UNVERIFIED_ORG: DNA-binding FadR family transcriptional regulator [Martelella mediterranea]